MTFNTKLILNILTKIFYLFKKLFNFKKSKFWGRDIRSVAYCGFQRLGKATADKNSFKVKAKQNADVFVLDLINCTLLCLGQKVKHVLHRS